MEQSMDIMTEEDIRQYFIQNGGIVQNKDIVNYFRPYLSKPGTRDDARALFKTYVNKLASVKVENGEKFLVLKRQYFTPAAVGPSAGVDGNGNPILPRQSGPVSRPPGSISVGSYSSMTSLASSSTGASMYGGGGYPSSGGYPVPVPMAPVTMNQQGVNVNYLRRQNSQPQLYGSQFSLNSNYMDPYNNSENLNNQYPNQNLHAAKGFYPASHFAPQQQHQPESATPYQPRGNIPQQLNLNAQQQHQAAQFNTSGTEYPAEYGLPTVPLNVTSPPRRYAVPQHAYGNSFSGSPSFRAPPPYRPPPPTLGAGRLSISGGGSPSSGAFGHHGISRRSSMTALPGTGVSYHRTSSVPGGGSGGGGPSSYYSTSSTHNMADMMMDPGLHAFQYHRSASVTGLNQSGVGSSTYFDTSSSLGLVGAPPVPPRSRRSVERSPSAVNTNTFYPSSSATNANGVLRTRLNQQQRMEMDHRLNGNSIQTNNSIQTQQPQPHVQMPGVVVAEPGATIQGEDNDGSNHILDSEQEKENIHNFQYDAATVDGTNNSLHNGHDGRQSSAEVEQKISVKERMQKFNRIASESEIGLGAGNANGSKGTSARSRRENAAAAKLEAGDFDTASLSSYGYSNIQLDSKSKEWMMRAIKCDYPVLNKMAQENSALVRRKDMNYTALHWAAKQGNLECVKLLAGAYKAEVNAKSNGGYTPLHLAAQFGRQDVYDVLIRTYNADANTRDHSGKKPMQYLVRQDASMSMDTFKKLKEKRRNTDQQRERDNSFLRIGSLNVKVKSTRDAFGYFLGKTTSSSSISSEKVQKTWGSADNLQEIEESAKDKQMMPPPTGVSRTHPKPSKKRPKRAIIDSTIIKESKSDSDSDSAFGFGSEWVSPVRE